MVQLSGSMTHEQAEFIAFSVGNMGITACQT